MLSLPFWPQLRYLSIRIRNYMKKNYVIAVYDLLLKEVSVTLVLDGLKRTLGAGNLIALGIKLKDAIIAGMSSKGPYCMSRTKVTQMAMTNAWLKQQGLISINPAGPARCSKPQAFPCRRLAQAVAGHSSLGSSKCDSPP